MTLLNKLKSAGAVGLTSLAVGCGTVGPDGRTQGEAAMDAFTSTFLGPIAGANAQLADTQQEAAAWGAISQAGNNAFYRDTQIEAAKAGKTEVNVMLARRNQTII